MAGLFRKPLAWVAWSNPIQNTYKSYFVPCHPCHPTFKKSVKIRGLNNSLREISRIAGMTGWTHPDTKRCATRATRKRKAPPETAGLLPGFSHPDERNYSMSTKIEKIKKHHTLAPMVARACGGLRPSGHSKRYLVGYCPRCQVPGKRAKPRRFWVDTEKQLCNCFKPGCGQDRAMDVINFWAWLQNTDNDGAIAELHYYAMTKQVAA